MSDLLPPTAPTLADAETIRHVAREIVARPEYQLEPPSQTVEQLFQAILDFLGWLLSPFLWLINHAFDISPVLGWAIVITMVLIAIALTAHIIYAFKKALQLRPLKTAAWNAARRVTDPEVYERQAAACAESGDFIGAVRLVFRACLLRLERLENHAFRAGLTNRELLRRYQNVTLSGALSTLVETIDSKWYGHDRCGPADYDACLRAQQIVRQYTERQVHAQRA